jgi:predicted Ser/Thr protein kinase
VTAGPSNLNQLSAADRAELESWLIEFDRAWTRDSLAAGLLALPDAPWRAAALSEMVKIDMEQLAGQGQPVSLEHYLLACPELGTRDTVAADLVAHEYITRREHGEPVLLAEYFARFPAQEAELEKVLTAAPDFSVAPASGLLFTGEPDSFAPSTGSIFRLPTAPPQLPEQFGRYRILQRLGGGGMGTVYLARDTQSDRQVALKVPHFSTDDAPEVIQRFLREARAAAVLDHPRICPLYDVGEIDGVHYLTMAYIEGKPLSDLASEAKTSPLSQRQVALLVRQLALALQEAHRRGVVHRDLKPSNVMIDSQDEPILMDFGLARLTDASTGQLTRSGSVLGTPAYMAPEQARGETRAIGPACDVYSLGAILYELLTGHRPFTGPMGTVLYKVIHEQPASPALHRADLDPRLTAICLRALAKRVEDRFGSMEEMAAALEEFLGAK